MSHDIRMAAFHIYESENEVKINITFDLENLGNALNLAPNQITMEAISKYINQKTEFRFNDEEQIITLTEMSIVEDHLKVAGSFEPMDYKITKLEIWNTCLINIRKHSNIIQTDLNSVSKDFRMHKGRTTINVIY